VAASAGLADALPRKAWLVTALGNRSLDTSRALKGDPQVATLYVIVAAYGSLELALVDWERLDEIAAPKGGLLDVVLIERFDLRVKTLHRRPATGWAQGWVASAAVGRLAPSALLDGALAGGVGRRALHLVSQGLSANAVRDLGRVLDGGRFVLIGVADQRAAITGRVSNASSAADTSMAGDATALRRAVEEDRADD
jgi:hypothetical protein